MKMNPRIVLLLLGALSLALGSCKKENAGRGDDLPPELLLAGKSELRDTFKFGRTPRYAFDFEIVDDQSEWTLGVSKLEEALVYYDGRIINDNPVNLKGAGKGQLELRPLQAGNFTFVVEARDLAGRAGTALVQAVAFDNLLPVAVLKAVQTDSLASGQVRLNATGSFDRDARWGGKVMRYEFKIGDFYQATVTRSQINYIFPEPGTYRLTLRVQDDDDAWSEPVVQDFIVE